MRSEKEQQKAALETVARQLSSAQGGSGYSDSASPGTPASPGLPWQKGTPLKALHLNVVVDARVLRFTPTMSNCLEMNLNLNDTSVRLTVTRPLEALEHVLEPLVELMRRRRAGCGMDDVDMNDVDQAASDLLRELSKNAEARREQDA